MLMVAIHWEACGDNEMAGKWGKQPKKTCLKGLGVWESGCPKRSTKAEYWSLCIILWTSWGCQDLFGRRREALWVCERCVFWLGKERERSPSFLVSFWGSIITPLAIQESLILFQSLWTVTFVCFSFAKWRGKSGLGFGGVLSKVSRKSGVLIRKVSGGIWLAHPHCVGHGTVS